MAGEDYVSPINGKTYRVPKYEEPADAPVAFKDFADNLPPGGIDFEPDRIGQVVQSLDGADWDKGMSLNVVQDLPADDAEGYEIGDVVFVLGDADPKDPGVGSWSEVTDASVTPIQYGDYDRYVFDTAGSHYITLTEGIAAILMVGAGGSGYFEGAPGGHAGGGGGLVQYGLHFFSDGRKDIQVAAAPTGAVAYPGVNGGATTMTGVATTATGGNAGGNTRAGDGSGGAERTPNGGPGVIIDGVEYGRGGYLESGFVGTPTEKPSSTGTHGWGASGSQPSAGDTVAPEQPATGGLVMVDVIRKTITKANPLPPFGWPIEETV